MRGSHELEKHHQLNDPATPSILRLRFPLSVCLHLDPLSLRVSEDKGNEKGMMERTVKKTINPPLKEREREREGETKTGTE